ncbi:UNVERIFIED_CONTAM: hypothetical protein PYX00_007779 [Menopon gallinae]|uniref:oxaloacetate tautomerase n=1 Tax=Menopon gallinae TaxID=328185 RepID=A0AAW2HLM9_9NEOP
MQSAADTDMVANKVKNFVKCGKKIVGAGLNYRSAIAALKVPPPKEPLIFLKPTTSYIVEDQCIQIPDACLEIVHEAELGVVIGKKGRRIKEEDVYDHVGGYCLALDMTDIGLLGKAKNCGWPWTLAKGWDTSCPVSRFICKEELPDPENVRLTSKLNCKLVQDASTCDMYFSIPKLISYISEYMTLEPCDLILTGTPCGSATVKPGDLIEANLGDIVRMEFEVVEEC